MQLTYTDRTSVRKNSTHDFESLIAIGYVKGTIFINIVFLVSLSSDEKYVIQKNFFVTFFERLLLVKILV